MLAGADTLLDDDVLDRIDEIAPPGEDIGVLDVGYRPPAIQQTRLRRRSREDRAAA